MEDLLFPALFSPLAGFLIILLSSSFISHRLTGLIASSAIFLSFIFFTLILFSGHADFEKTLYRWMPIQGLKADMALYLDHLSLLMALIITGVGFLIHVYSIGYMEHDKDLPRYFACMNFFVFNMLLLVLASNLLLLFIGWEGVGLASYLLIGYYYTKTAAADAAVKAFVVNRIGDAGLFLGIIFTFFLFGTSNFLEINERVGTEFSTGAPILIILTALYFIGAIGKSAQLPLHVWLPDAMEGPTPVSALIHAATMVTAGVYLVVRLHPVFLQAPPTLYTVGLIGGATSLFAALSATAQTDLKRVLAYSTISQLGLMFLACGVGSFYSAMFHLTTHAFAKALLFLSAGIVIHMMHGLTDMNKMGGLYKKFPTTHWLFLIGVLTMSGLPPLSIFFSKDLILESEHAAGLDMLFYTGLATSLLTAFYLTRAYCLAFLGEPHLKETLFAKEGPRVMLIPTGFLALLSLTGGFLGFCFCQVPWLENFLKNIGITEIERELSAGVNIFLTKETWFAMFSAILGIGAGYLLYTLPTLSLLKNGFYLDEIYRMFIGAPLEGLSRWIVAVFEPKLFDGSIRFVSHKIDQGAGTLQKLQNGEIRAYLAYMVIGIALVLVFLL